MTAKRRMIVYKKAGKGMGRVKRVVFRRPNKRRPKRR